MATFAALAKINSKKYLYTKVAKVSKSNLSSKFFLLYYGIQTYHAIIPANDHEGVVTHTCIRM